MKNEYEKYTRLISRNAIWARDKKRNHRREEEKWVQGTSKSARQENKQEKMRKKRQQTWKQDDTFWLKPMGCSYSVASKLDLKHRRTQRATKNHYRSNCSNETCTRDNKHCMPSHFEQSWSSGKRTVHFQATNHSRQPREMKCQSNAIICINSEASDVTENEKARKEMKILDEKSCKNSEKINRAQINSDKRIFFIAKSFAQHAPNAKSFCPKWNENES